VEEELAWVRALSARHPQFRCIDVTGIGVEEVAHDHVMTTLPRRPTPVEVALEALGCNFLLASAGGADDDLLARVRYCSDGLCLLAGRAREQIVGQPLEASSPAPRPPRSAPAPPRARPAPRLPRCQ
jgi:hypothetical protein